jgi:peptide methionine sulfoxide reductase MsrA
MYVTLLLPKASNWFYEAEDYHQDLQQSQSALWKAFRYRDTTSLKKHIKES